MRLLLDTHCWLWSIPEPMRLSPRARHALRDRSNTVLVSAVTSWEIAIKYSLGRLPLPEPPGVFIPSRIRRDGFEPLVVTHEHALGVGRLPLIHRDPFDRLLISQALSEDAVLVTNDKAIRRYDAAVL